MAQAAFSFSFNANVIALLNVGSIIVDYYAFKNPFRWSFKPYINMCMESTLPSSGSTTTMLLNVVIHSYMEPHYYSSCNLSWAMFLLSSGVY